MDAESTVVPWASPIQFFHPYEVLRRSFFQGVLESRAILLSLFVSVISGYIEVILLIIALSLDNLNHGEAG